jgi:hypothetical protein
MIGPMVSLADAVVVEYDAPDGRVEAVERALREAGIEATVDASYESRALGALIWLVDVSLGTGLVAFFKTLGEEAGKDAWAAMKQLVTNLLAARVDDGEGRILLRADDYNDVYVLGELPDEAYRALFDLDWSELRAGSLVWRDGEWYNSTPPLKTTGE